MKNIAWCLIGLALLTAGDTVVVGDPAQGLQRMGWKAFGAIWRKSGIVVKRVGDQGRSVTSQRR